MAKIYDIILDKTIIGTTELKKSDPYIGDVFGQISFIDASFGYIFFKDYCLKNNIEFIDYPEYKLISTFNIPDLQVLNPDQIEIKGSECYVSGRDSDNFEIIIKGIQYPFFGEEFPNDVKS